VLFWICAIFSTVIAQNVMLAIVLGAYQDLREDYLRWVSIISIQFAADATGYMDLQSASCGC
jgi:hypothetical protein